MHARKRDAAFDKAHPNLDPNAPNMQGMAGIKAYQKALKHLGDPSHPQSRMRKLAAKREHLRRKRRRAERKNNSDLYNVTRRDGGVVIGHVRAEWLGEAQSKAERQFGENAQAWSAQGPKGYTPVGERLWGHLQRDKSRRKSRVSPQERARAATHLRRSYQSKVRTIKRAGKVKLRPGQTMFRIWTIKHGDVGFVAAPNAREAKRIATRRFGYRVTVYRLWTYKQQVRGRR